jgi:hypothetical protein
MLKKIDLSPKAFTIFYGAVGSIIASMIWKFAPTFGDWLAVSSLGVLVDFVNARYVRAATLESVNYSFFVLTSFFVVFAVIWFEIVNRLKNIFSDNNKINVGKKIKSEPSPIVKKIIYRLIQFITPVFIIYGLFQIFGEVIVLNAITDFNQHIRIITPYISKEENDKLISQWSQMRSLNDYNKICEKLSTVAQANDLKLYRNRMY